MINNLRLSDTVEDLKLQKYITEEIDNISKDLDFVVEDIRERVYKRWRLDSIEESTENEEQ